MNGLRPKWPSGRRELGVTSIEVSFCCRHLLRVPHLPVHVGVGDAPRRPIALTPEHPLRDPRISAASSRDSFAPLMPPEEPVRNASAVPLAAPPPGTLGPLFRPF
jgi:hypothetical protein